MRRWGFRGLISGKESVRGHKINKLTKKLEIINKNHVDVEGYLRNWYFNYFDNIQLLPTLKIEVIDEITSSTINAASNELRPNYHRDLTVNFEWIALLQGNSVMMMMTCIEIKMSKQIGGNNQITTDGNQYIQPEQEQIVIMQEKTPIHHEHHEQHNEQQVHQVHHEQVQQNEVIYPSQVDETQVFIATQQPLTVQEERSEYIVIVKETRHVEPETHKSFNKHNRDVGHYRDSTTSDCGISSI